MKLLTTLIAHSALSTLFANAALAPRQTLTFSPPPQPSDSATATTATLTPSTLPPTVPSSPPTSSIPEPTTSADPLPPPPPPPPPPRKAGLTWVNGERIDVEQYLTTGKVSWYYNWSPWPTVKQIEYVPMLWGHRQVQQFVDTINNTIAEYNVTHVLGMNEPQEPGQANMSPEEGAIMWRTYLEPLRARGIRLGSPAPSGNPNGKKWLTDWLAACDGGCNPDFMAIHWYDVNATQFEQYVNEYWELFRKPIWVTEWACQNFNNFSAQCSMEDIIYLMNRTQTFMDNAPYVERYSWFGAFVDLSGVNPLNGLMHGNDTISDLGRQYIGEREVSYNITGPVTNETTRRGPGGGMANSAESETHDLASSWGNILVLAAAIGASFFWIP